MRRFLILIALGVANLSTMMAGKFNCGRFSFTSDQVTLEIPRPPDAYPQVKSIKVEVGESDDRFRDQSRLKLQIEQALSGDFAVTAAKPEARMIISVVAFDPAQVTQQQRTEQRSVEISKGKTEIQSATVTYWVGKGRISLRVEMLDADGALLDSFSPEENYAETREIAVNGQPSAKVDTNAGKRIRIPKMGGGKSAVNAVAALPTTEQDVHAEILNGIAELIRRRYVRTVDFASFKLACDDELRAGNKLALGTTPDWEGAIKVWESATVKDKDNQGDKIFNLAVAQEALAYKAYSTTLNPADATPFFDKALELYEAASKADPEEKYIRQTVERLKTAKVNVARAVDQRKVWESERDKKRTEYLAKREGMKAISLKREDSGTEKSLRVLARNNLKGKNPKAEEMVRNVGEKLGMDEISIQRIWVQENERLKGLGAYEEQVNLAIADGLLSKPERETLKILLPTFNMSEEDALEVEAKLKFTEEGKEPPAPAPLPAALPPGLPAPAKAVAPKVIAPVKAAAPAKAPAAIPVKPAVKK